MNEIQDKKAFILEILRKYDSPYFQRKLEGEEESNKKNAQMRSKLLISEREALKNKKLNEEGLFVVY
ncbi:12191_t:CDS:2 [Entrophospora sp. SA101]|nr:16753_t:CDS:2 [Entrophospora sp. SA101]CAJ0763327.1 12191_t:CDS:2 [Entrophospora sp. SA101]